MKLYSCVISNGNEVVMALYPCVKDGKAGLYDLVSREIFYDATGTGNAFTCGAEVDPPAGFATEYVKVDGSPTRYGMPSPDYGMTTNVTSGTSYTFTCPAVYTNDAETIAAKCTGYTLALTNGNVYAGSALSTSIVYSAEMACSKLTWLWKEQFKATVVTRCDGTETTNAAACVWSDTAGKVMVTAPASPKAGFAFSHWEGTGLVFADYKYDVSLTVTLTKPGMLTAVYLPVRYVKPDGSDAADGLTWETAWATPQKAVDAFPSTSGVVYLGAGTFTGAQPLLTITNAVLVTGRGAGKTFLAPDNSTNLNTVVIDAASGVLRQVSVTDNTKASAVKFGSKGGLLCETTVATNSAGGILFPSLSARSRGTVSRCEIVDNKGTAIGCYQTDTLYVRNSLIARNVSSGQAAAVYARYVDWQIYFDYCTFIDNYGPNGCALKGSYVHNKNFNLRNCIIDNTASSTCTAPNFGNDYYGVDGCFTIKNTYSPEKKGTNPVEGSLNLADRANGDYRLRPGSACRDAGAAVGSSDAEWRDLDGNGRMTDGTPDVGCYEYVASSKTSCDISVSSDEGALGGSVTFTGISSGSGDYDYYWQVVDSAGAVMTNGTGQTFEPTLTGAYGYTKVTLWVTNTLDAADNATYTLKDAVYVRPATTYVVPADVAGAGDGTYPYGSWATATTNVQAAVDAVFTGGTVILSNGTHGVFKQVEIMRELTLKGFGGRDNTTLKHVGSVKNRTLYLNCANARVEDLTLYGGDSDVCWTYGYCVRIDSLGGTIADCRITGVSTSQAGGGAGVALWGGRVTRTIIDNNKYTYTYSFNGGGVYMEAGLVDSCLIKDNKGLNGGGVYLKSKGRLVNCTITGNYSINDQGGGLRIGELTSGTGCIENCIVIGNSCSAAKSATTGYPEWVTDVTDSSKLKVVSNSVVTCCFGRDFAWPLGSTYVNADPLFTDAAAGDYTLNGNSKLINAGTDYDGVADDLDLGKLPRKSGKSVDVGCHEYDLSKRTISFTVDPQLALAGNDVTLTGNVRGGDETIGYTYAWTVTPTGKTEVAASGSANPYVVNTLAPGRYDVTLTVNETASGAFVDKKTLSDILQVGAKTNYVVTAEGYAGDGGTWPYDTWDKATTNIFTALDAAVAGGTVHLADGTYRIDKMIVLTNAVALIGNGWDRASIIYKNTSVKSRMMSIRNRSAKVEGLTLTGGNLNVCWTKGFAVEITTAGGALVRCRVTGNTCPAGGVCGAVALLHSDSIGNVGRISQCLFDKNTDGGQTYNNCGGAIYTQGGTVENCVFANNSGSYTGGITFDGSGKFVVRNCTFHNNKATLGGFGGAIYFSVNGTGTCRNLIFSESTNSANKVYRDFAGNSWKNASNSFDYCLFDARVGDGTFKLGEHSLVGSAVFRRLRSDATNTNWRLRPSSPGFKAGLYDATWMATGVDFYGEKRVKRYKKDVGFVDIGAAEAEPAGGTLIVVR